MLGHGLLAVVTGLCFYKKFLMYHCLVLLNHYLMISSMVTHKTIAKNTSIDTNACGMVNRNEAEQTDILINEKIYRTLRVKQSQVLKETREHETSW